MTLTEKILNKQELTSDEIKSLVFEDYGEQSIEYVEEIRGKDRRWTRTNQVILKINDRYFRIKYEQGLTEYQENEYYSQIAEEVKRVEKTITIVEYE